MFSWVELAVGFSRVASSWVETLIELRPIGLLLRRRGKLWEPRGKLWRPREIKALAPQSKALTPQSFFFGAPELSARGLLWRSRILLLGKAKSLALGVRERGFSGTPEEFLWSPRGGPLGPPEVAPLGPQRNSSGPPEESSGGARAGALRVGSRGWIS